MVQNQVTKGQPLKAKIMGVTGPSGLLVSVIDLAARDARAGMEDAIDYLRSDWYREHLDWLGLPNDWLPDGVNLN